VIYTPALITDRNLTLAHMRLRTGECRLGFACPGRPGVWIGSSAACSLTRPGGRRVTGGGPSDTNECEPNPCPAVCWRTAVTTVRIVSYAPQPARAGPGRE